MSQLVLTALDQTAARRYGRDYERTAGEGRPDRRMEAADDLRAARRSLTPAMVAVMDWVAGKGRSLADVAAMAGQPVAQVEGLFVAACRRLAEHYEAQL